MKKATIYVLLLIAGIALVSYILYGFRKIEAPVVIENPETQQVQNTPEEQQAIIDNESHSKD